jgi:hypothetical protein
VRLFGRSEGFFSKNPSPHHPHISVSQPPPNNVPGFRPPANVSGPSHHPLSFPLPKQIFPRRNLFSPRPCPVSAPGSWAVSVSEQGQGSFRPQLVRGQLQSRVGGWFGPGKYTGGGLGKQGIIDQPWNGQTRAGQGGGDLDDLSIRRNYGVVKLVKLRAGRRYRGRGR